MTEIELLADREARIAELEEQLAQARALNDRARLAIIRMRDQLDQLIGETAQEADPCTTHELASAPVTASASGSAAAPAGSGGRSTSSPQAAPAPTAKRTSVDLADSSGALRQLSCGWSLETFKMGFRVGRQVARDGVHLVLTIEHESPGHVVIPAAALSALLEGVAEVIPS